MGLAGELPEAAVFRVPLIINQFQFLTFTHLGGAIFDPDSV